MSQHGNHARLRFHPLFCRGFVLQRVTKGSSGSKLVADNLIDRDLIRIVKVLELLDCLGLVSCGIACHRRLLYIHIV